MAEKTLACSDSKEFKFPSITGLIGLDPTLMELNELRAKDPGYIQFTEELRRTQQGIAEFDQEQLERTMSQALRNPEIEKMLQRVRNHLLQNPPQLSLSLGSPEASEYFAERMARMQKDPELIPILAEIDVRGVAVFFKFWDDKDVLKKLAKAATLGLAEGMNDDEQVSEGRKALDIAFGYANIKYVKILLDAGVFNPGYRRKSSAAKPGRKRHVHRNKGDAIAPQNMESVTPTDVATTSSQAT